MQLAMYKGPARSLFQKFFHWGVCLVTRSKYSHIEFAPGEMAADGTHLCLSSSQRDGGVRFKRIDLSTGHWDLYPLKWSDEQTKALAIQWFIDHDGQKYDYVGLLWFVLRIRIERPDRQFCSEAIAAAFGLTRPYRFSPQMILDQLCEGAPLAQLPRKPENR